jgi:hypothetical protein
MSRKEPKKNILAYLDIRKPFGGIPYAFCRWYLENPKYADIPSFSFLYERMSMLNWGSGEDGS